MNQRALKAALARYFWLILLVPVASMILHRVRGFDWLLYYPFLLLAVWIWLEYREESAKSSGDEEAPFRWRDRLVATVLIIGGWVAVLLLPAPPMS